MPGRLPVPVAGVMHYRFEIRLLSRFIAGRRPEVCILRIAWEDRVEHLQHWLEAYYRRHHALPRGCHDPGPTPRHCLAFGIVDFGAARDRLAREREFGRRYERLPRWSRHWLSVAARVMDEILRERLHWRGRRDPEAGRIF